MAQPEGFGDKSQPHHVCRLTKALYGLKQAPKAWFDKLKGALIQKGFQTSVSDSSLFFSRVNGKLVLFLVHVDDILITGEDSQQIALLVHDQNSQFALKTLGSVHYIIGLKLIEIVLILRLLVRSTLLICWRKLTCQFKLSLSLMCQNKKLFLGGNKEFDHPTVYGSTIGALQTMT